MIQAKQMVVLVASALAVSFCVSQSGGQPRSTRASHHDKSWKLVWQDEFEGPDGSQPNPEKWTLVTGGSGYGNKELEYYTDRTVNAHLEHGSLIITARKEGYKGPDGVARDYTSARMETRGHFQTQYGRIEARIKLPGGGQGIWPAFWLLGDNYASVGWPECGELDIVENIGSEPYKVHGSLHGPGYSGGNPLTGEYSLDGQSRFSEDYHTFAIEWEPKAIRFYVDNHLFETQTPDNLPPGKRWAFDHPFFLLLNLAVGGYWPGVPDATTSFPAQMAVDYVRVYQREEE